MYDITEKVFLSVHAKVNKGAVAPTRWLQD